MLGSLSNMAATTCQKLTGTDCSTGLPRSAASTSNLQNFLQIIFAIFAVIAVLVVIIAAFNIVIAQGDSSKVAKQRSTIIYALVGLAVAISAEIIVTSVLGRF